MYSGWRALEIWPGGGVAARDLGIPERPDGISAVELVEPGHQRRAGRPGIGRVHQLHQQPDGIESDRNAAATPAAFATCVTNLARCRFCLGVVVGDDIDPGAIDCDVFDDTVANASCPP